ncbi:MULTISPECIES: TrbI/VirB10 family protein [unclassified Sphingopyxis]|jgi:type IV secretion system protein VirB10|uniref:TrbI/VirB10 family protein n=1 Tax=unclassified Sphingopyxis TaxID=2614943 RepID=UPI0025D473EC|nr:MULTISPECIES: TrbI/VirB10 family protein [unclassified Sphingopyxis]
MTEAADQTETPARKVDPETLVLRGSPGRATRFRRSVVIAVSGVGALALAGTAWLALGRGSTGPIALPGERAPLAARGQADVFADAPTGYDDVPRLGPPLPGDLGRPILNQQRDMALAPPASASGDEQASAVEAAAAERQRIAAEQRAARESAVMLQLTNPAARAAPAVNGAAAAAHVDAPVDGPVANRDPSAQPRQNALAMQANTGDDVSPHRLAPPTSPWTVQAGSVIAASLITGLNSDLPGLVTAQVTAHVHDSVTGRHLLIPQGSRLIGSYDNVVAFGQSRALVVWQRIILPDGSSIRIDNAPASDTQGYAGLSDRIDRHTWQLLKGVALSTLLGVGSELGWGSSESDLVRAVRESAQQNGARTGDQLVGRSLDVQPTLRVRPGWPLRIIVHKDIVLRPWRSVEN